MLHIALTNAPQLNKETEAAMKETRSILGGQMETKERKNNKKLSKNNKNILTFNEDGDIVTLRAMVKHGMEQL